MIESLLAFLSTTAGQALLIAGGTATVAVLFKLARFALGLAKREAKRTPTPLDDDLVELAEDLVDTAEDPAKQLVKDAVAKK